MQTEFLTTDIEEFSWYTVFNTGPECKQRLEYFHYTNLENLKYILKGDCIDLRFTRADCFADQQEMRHILQIFENVCTELLKKGDIDAEFYKLIKKCILDSRGIIEEYRKYYVFCLSANANSVYLKEKYACRGGKDGAIIGIRAIAFEDVQFGFDVDQEAMIDGFYIYDVIYNGNELEDCFYKIIKQLYKLGKRIPEKIAAARRTISALIRYGLVYKRASFAQEEETRLMADVSRLTLSKEHYYQDDLRYLHILLPIGSHYETVKITKRGNDYVQLQIPTL